MTAKYFAAVLSALKSLKLIPGSSWQFGLFIWLLLAIPAQAAVQLRVAIEKGANEVKVGSSTPAVVRDGTGRQVGSLTNLDAFVAVPQGKGVAIGNWQASQLIIEPTEGGYVWIGDRWYRGRTRLMRQGTGITAVNLVDLESYLYSVVGSEAVPTWPQDALKSQAVAART